MFQYIRDFANLTRYVRYGVLGMVGYAAFVFFKKRG